MSNIAVISVNVDIEYCTEIMRGVRATARSNNMGVYVFNANTTDTFGEGGREYNIGQLNIFRLINYSKFDGVIVFTNTFHSSPIFQNIQRELERLDIPVVCIDAPVGDNYYVGVDNYKSMKLMVEHFIVHHKFSKLNYISGPFQSADAQMRLAAYCDALKEHGISVEQKRIFVGPYDGKHGVDSVNKMLQSGMELPEAIICATDLLAMGAIETLKENNISVPGDVAVSGFDNSFESRNYAPNITSVDRSLYSVGVIAVEKIVNHINGIPQSKTQVFPATPVYRESCGCINEDKSEEKDVRSRYLKMVDYYDCHLEEETVMVQDLNDSRNLDDFIIRLVPYIQNLERSFFCLCLDRKFINELQQEKSNEMGNEDFALKSEGFADRIGVAVAYENGKRVFYDDFDVSQMTPWEIEPDVPKYMVFSPLHYQDKCFGYVIMENDKPANDAALQRTWLINLSNGLENLRKNMNLRKLIDRLDSLYIKDPLTGLYNRFGFARYAKASFEDCKQNKKKAMILFADLDGLKGINDKYGHDKGDIAIKALAGAIVKTCTSGEVCARFGGDEFVIYADDYSKEKADFFCNRFLENLHEIDEQLGYDFRIRASYGYNVFVPKEDDDIEVFIDDADQKMYKQKKSRKAIRTN